jgi:hypothetical protein
MTTNELIGPPRPAASAPPTFGEMLEETLPLIGVIPVAGPPAVLLAAPWLLLVLVLVGYFALMLTVAAVLVAAAALVGLVRDLAAAPHRLVRELRGYRAPHLPARAPAARLVAGQPR